MTSVWKASPHSIHLASEQANTVYKKHSVKAIPFVTVSILDSCCTCLSVVIPFFQRFFFYYTASWLHPAGLVGVGWCVYSAVKSLFPACLLYISPLVQTFSFLASC